MFIIVIFYFKLFRFVFQSVGIQSLMKCFSNLISIINSTGTLWRTRKCLRIKRSECKRLCFFPRRRRDFKYFGFLFLFRNVQSLSNKEEGAASVEMRIAKACFTIFFLYVCAWTPYAIVALIGSFGNKALLTPAVTMIPAVCAKIVSCIDRMFLRLS